MAWGAALGEIFGNTSQGMVAAAQYQASKHERNIAWKRQQQWEQIAPGLKMEGLRRAGVNPMALFLGPGGGLSHGTSVPMASPGGTPQFSKDSVSRVITSAKQARAMDAEIRILEEKAAQEALHTRRVSKETDVVEKFAEPTARAEMEATFQGVLNLITERGLSTARTSQSEAERARILMDRMIMEMGVPGARAIEEMYEKYPWLRQLREFSGGGMGSAAIGGAGAGAAYLFGRRRGRESASDDFGSATPGKKRRKK